VDNVYSTSLPLQTNERNISSHKKPPTFQKKASTNKKRITLFWTPTLPLALLVVSHGILRQGLPNTSQQVICLIGAAMDHRHSSPLSWRAGGFVLCLKGKAT